MTFVLLFFFILMATPQAMVWPVSEVDVKAAKVSEVGVKLFVLLVVVVVVVVAVYFPNCTCNRLC